MARSRTIEANKLSITKVRLPTHFFTFKKEGYGSQPERNTNHQQLPLSLVWVISSVSFASQAIPFGCPRPSR